MLCSAEKVSMWLFPPEKPRSQPLGSVYLQENALALGDERGRLLRQLLVESGALVVVGAGLRWVFVMYATELPARMARMARIESGLSPDGGVLGFTLSISVLADLAFGLAPLRAATGAPGSGWSNTSDFGIDGVFRRGEECA